MRDLRQEFAVGGGGGGLVEEQFEGLPGIEPGQCPAQAVDGRALLAGDEQFVAPGPGRGYVDGGEDPLAGQVSLPAAANQLSGPRARSPGPEIAGVLPFCNK